MPRLSSVQQKFILHWGEMGTRWGINRTVAQVHALLYISPAPLNADDIVETLANLAEFYAHESCGQCTPCREGALWMSKALHRMTHGEGRKADADYLLHIAQNIQGRTICAFGEAAAWPVLSFVKKFKEDFEAKGAADEAKAKSAGPSHEMSIALSPKP